MDDCRQWNEKKEKGEEEKKALEIQKELRQMELENREPLRQSGEADGMSPTDGTGSQDL